MDREISFHETNRSIEFHQRRANLLRKQRQIARSVDTMFSFRFFIASQISNLVSIVDPRHKSKCNLNVQRKAIDCRLTRHRVKFRRIAEEQDQFVR